MALMTSLRGLLQRRKAEREIDHELAFHVEMETHANVARGMAPAAARQAALRAFGGVARAKETVRDVRTLRIESVWQDVRYASRTLAAHRRFTLAAAGMLALAIGLTTAHRDRHPRNLRDGVLRDALVVSASGEGSSGRATPVVH
jgi:hypothetical protein